MKRNKKTHAKKYCMSNMKTLQKYKNNSIWQIQTY